MFCKCSIHEWYSVAIKKPKSKESYIWNSLKQKKTFDNYNDINKWITECFSKTNQQWQHHLLYNDQLPEYCHEYSKYKGIDNNGHCKGILVWNHKKIAWLIHSIPQFPSVKMNESYEFPEINVKQLEMGQSAIYLEFDISHKPLIISQLGTMNIQVYYMTEYLEDLKFNNTIPSFNSIVLKKKWYFGFNKNKITHYAKNNKFLYDIYEIMSLNDPTKITNTMPPFEINEVINNTSYCKKTNMICQSWLNGNVNKLNSKENIFNVSHLKEWQTHIDHSKWAISIPINNYLFNKFKYKVCIGDLNRVDTQLKRSGGCVLIENKNLWYCFKNLIPE